MTAEQRAPHAGSSAAVVSPLATAPAPAGLVRVTVAASIGTFVEYFDLVVYGALAGVMATVFFPASDGVAGLLNSFAIFALAFAARPVGGLLWGPLGDRIGRKRVLATIIIVASGATGLVGLLPSYEVIGIWAPLALVLLRFVQGFSAGGEMPGAAIFVGEYARPGRRAFQTSFLASAVSVAQLAALAVATVLMAVMSADDLGSWGWRIPFLLAVPIGIVGVYIRSRLEETPVFNQIADAGTKSRSPLRQVLGSRAGWAAIGRSVLISLPCQVPGFLLLTFMPTFLMRSAGLSGTEALVSIAVAACVVLVMQPLGGRLSDRIGRRPMLFLVALAEVVTAYPAFALILEGGHVLPTLGLILIGAPFGLATGSQLAPILESFPTALRYTGFAASLGLVTALLAGPSPFISTWLVSVTGSSYAPAWLLMAVALPPLIGAFLLRETHDLPLAG